MGDPITETRLLAESYGLQFKDVGNGHVQISGHGLLVNYYPTSKKKSVWVPALNRREANCTPWDAVRLCMSDAKPGMKPKKPTKNKAQVSLEPVRTNPAGIKHFYEKADVPPWDESLGPFQFMHSSDELRVEALHIEYQAVTMRGRADEMDGTDK